MRGSVKKQSSGRYTVVYDAGQQPRHECGACRWRSWAEGTRRPDRCPECDASSVTVVQARRQIRKSGFAKKTGPGGADAWLADQIRKVETGTHVDPSAVSLAEFVHEVWLPSLTVSPNTAKKYEEMTRCHIVPALGPVRLQRLDVPRITGMMNDLAQSGGRRGDGLSPKSLKHVHYTLNKLLNDARDWDYIGRNPMERIEGPKVPPGEMKVWTAGQLRSFLDWMEAHPMPSHEERLGPRPARLTQGRRLLAMWKLLATTGMRREELLGLRWADVDFDRRVLAVEWVCAEVGPMLVYKRPKTNPKARENASRRRIALDERTVQALRDWRKEQIAERLAAGERWVQDVSDQFDMYPDGRPGSLDLVFRAPGGGPLSPRGVTDIFPVLAEQAGLPRLTMHGVRHTYATMMLLSGAHLKIVSQRLGHTTISQTLDLYSWVLPAFDEDAAQAGADLLYSAPASMWARRCTGCARTDPAEVATPAASDPQWSCPHCGGGEFVVNTGRPDDGVVTVL